MKVSGFSFIRNAIKYDYPIVEAVQSVLPLCDEFVIAIGKSDDATLELIKSIHSPKIKIIETVWDDSKRKDGVVLAEETNKAFHAIDEDSDWAFYIQGDELLHEQYLDAVREQMLRWKDFPEVDGLLFRYKHFYGSYDYVAISPRWYRHEIRIIRNRKNIYSYRDAQGFRKDNNKKLNVKRIDAFIYHYGWVKHPQFMQQKIENFGRLYHDDQWMETHIPKANEFDYSGIDLLTRFEGQHPHVMQERIVHTNWSFDHDLSKSNLSWKYRLKLLVEKWTGYQLFEYKNYRLLKNGE
ncbi:MAG: hypothetical protein LBD45_05025 [Bacteroidales bacterium]|jgi:hypothetical protein|nr:hypothetical protein [Bacteroidales bacterium]